jgi:hypothetical protein
VAAPCRGCDKQFNERSAGRLNRTQYPSDGIVLVVRWGCAVAFSTRDEILL